jgi:hypothetical protein
VTWAERWRVAFALHDSGTPRRQVIDSQSWKPRVCMLGFCWLWITLTTIGTMVEPASQILEGLWRMSFVVPQLGWIAIPLVIRVRTSDFVANVKHMHPDSTPQN